jgi:acyl carrier protein
MKIDLVISRITALLRDRFELDVSALTTDSKLRDLGIDSLHFVDVLMDLEDELGVKLTDLSFPPNPSLGEIAEVIATNTMAKA